MNDSYNWLFDEDSEQDANYASCSESPLEFNSIEPVWTTYEGEKIPLSKMTTRHIHNCIIYLESKRNSKLSKWWCAAFKCELQRRKATELTSDFSL